MAKKSKPDPKPFSTNEILYGALCIVTAAVFVAFVVVWFYYSRFRGQQISTDPAAWGQFGDYIGGLINPVVGLATVILVFLTLLVQRHELQASLSELKRSNESATVQSFEQSLFSWLTTYRELLNVMESGEQDDTGQQVRGRRLLSRWYERQLSLKDTGRFHCFGNTYFPEDERVRRLNRIEYLQKHIDAYRDLFRTNRSELDAYLRTLYRLFQWIDSNEDLKPSQKFHYAALVRAQLSWVELAFLFYNGFTVEGAAFVPFYERYAIFDNIKTGKDLLIDSVAVGEITHFGLLEDGPCVPLPYSQACFSSDLARHNADT